MNDLLSVPSQYLSLILAIIAVVTAVTTAYANYRKSGDESIMALKNQTIQALNERINMLEKKVQTLSESNSTQVQTLEIIKALLSRRGIQVVIDGDMVTIKDEDGEHTIQRRVAHVSSSPSA